MKDIVPISVVIPTYKRVHQLNLTLQKILECRPAPSEIIVHIDRGDSQTEQMLISSFRNVIVLKNANKVGPGGGRNEGIKNACNNLVASFDDDSYPIDSDYFLELLKTSKLYPRAAIIESKIYHLNENIDERTDELYEQYNFTGCGAAYHKNIFEKIGEYVPKPIAYGLEEVDFSMRAFQYNYSIIHNCKLRVLHNTNLKHHVSININAGAITNQALLIYLRYPIKLYIRGAKQLGNRIIWSIKNKRLRGIFKGIIDIPRELYKYRKYRMVLDTNTINTYLKIRSIRKILKKNNEL